MSKWKEYTLDEFLLINPPVKIKKGEIVSFIEMKNLDNSQKYVYSNVEKTFTNGSKFQENDTLFARITPCLENGKINKVKYLKTKVGFGSTEFIVLRGKEGISNNDYVFYLSLSSHIKNNAINLMTGTSGRQRVDKTGFEKINFFAPESLQEQKRIADILSSLDDKIELNNQMNQTLESMAQTIFKEWFVNFNFPGFDGELVDGLPKGWRKESIDKDIDFLNGIALQKYSAENEKDYLPVIKIRELRQGITQSTDKASINIPEKYIIQDGDILFSWSGSLDVVIWTNGKGALNQHLFKVSSDWYPKWFYYFWVKENLSKYQKIAANKATTMGHIQRKHLTETLINVPSEKVMTEANKILTPLLNKFVENSVQNMMLVRLRDNLLPKLMSRKIEIKL